MRRPIKLKRRQARRNDRRAEKVMAMFDAFMAIEARGLLVTEVVDTAGQIQPRTQLEVELGILQV